MIPTRDRQRDLAACLAAVRTAVARSGRTVEIIVVDDGSRDGTDGMIRALARRPGWTLRLVRHAESRGPAAARNAGVRAARAATLVFTDSDCLPSPGWLRALLAGLQASPELAAVEGRVIPRPAPPHDPYTQAVQNARGGRWLTCNLAVRRKAFLRAGGFDERYPLPVREDTDFAFALLTSGARIGFVPGAVVVHPIRRGGPGRFLREARQAVTEGLLFRKYPRLYLTRLKWIDGWAIPAYYLAPYAGVVGIIAGPHRAAALILWAAGTATIVAAWCRRTRWSLRLLPALSAEAALVPFVRLGWLAWGAARYALARRRPAR